MSAAEPAAGPLPPGTPAPDFTLQREDGSGFTPRELKGKTTLLVFYPFAFSPVCTDQLGLYEDVLSDYLAKRGATMYGVSCDARWSQTAFREKLENPRDLWQLLALLGAAAFVLEWVLFGRMNRVLHRPAGSAGGRWKKAS